MANQVTLTNAQGTTAEIISIGAAIRSLSVADRDGNFDDIVLGYDEITSYHDNPFYFGVVAGRYANRIAQGKFKLGEESYQLAQNNGDNHLHGGPTGFHLREWSISTDNDDNSSATLSYFSPDGEENFPGNLTVSVTYRLTDANELVIEYVATTDKQPLSTLLNIRTSIWRGMRVAVYSTIRFVLMLTISLRSVLIKFQAEKLRR